MKPLNRILGMSLVLLFWSVLGAYAGDIIINDTQTIPLSDDGNIITLWAEVEEPIDNIDSIEIKVTGPNDEAIPLSPGEEVGEYNDANQRFEWFVDGITEEGQYVIEYLITLLNEEPVTETRPLKVIAPGPFELISPIEEKLIRFYEVDFSWNPLPNSQLENISYTLFLKRFEFNADIEMLRDVPDDELFVEPITKAIMAKTACTLSNQDMEPGIYAWKVQAENTSTNTAFFKYEPLRLISPKTGYYVPIPPPGASASIQIPLRWEAYEGENVTYNLTVLCDEGSCEDIIVPTDITENHYTITIDFIGGNKYNWYVDAYINGEVVAQSVGFWFSCDNDMGPSGTLTGKVSFAPPDFKIIIQRSPDDDTPLILDQGDILLFPNGEFSVGIDDDYCSSDAVRYVIFEQAGYRSVRIEQIIKEADSAEINQEIKLYLEGDVDTNGELQKYDLWKIFDAFAGFQKLEDDSPWDTDFDSDLTLVDVANVFNVLPESER